MGAGPKPASSAFRSGSRTPQALRLQVQINPPLLQSFGVMDRQAISKNLAKPLVAKQGSQWSAPTLVACGSAHTLITEEERLA
jgi:hypothetical protein